MDYSNPRRTYKTRTNSGKNLKEEWEIPAKHVLYHKDGNYYMHLQQFPAALCDPSGYVIFKTEGDYKNSSYLQHGIQLHGSIPVHHLLLLLTCYPIIHFQH